MSLPLSRFNEVSFLPVGDAITAETSSPREPSFRPHVVVSPALDRSRNMKHRVCSNPGLGLPRQYKFADEVEVTPIGCEEPWQQPMTVWEKLTTCGSFQ